MSRLTALSRTPARPRFRVVRPDGEAVILPFPNRDPDTRSGPRAEARTTDSIVSVCESLASEGPQTLLRRAQALHRNRCCPNCRRAGVVPVDLGDGDDDHWAMPIPGTSTLVGFYCDACGAEWPA